MPKYDVSGEILIEGTGFSAHYDFEMEASKPPTDMEVLTYMLESGELQIIHEESIEVKEQSNG